MKGSRSTLTLTLKILFALALATGIAAFPVAALLARQAVTVQQVRLWDDNLIAFNQWSFGEDEWDDSVVAIYGSPEGEPLALLFVDPAQIIQPAEDPSLRLLPKRTGEHFVQVQTVYYFATITTGVALIAAALTLFLLWLVLRRRRASVTA